jgi:hypothetical protein
VELGVEERQAVRVLAIGRAAWRAVNEFLNCHVCFCVRTATWVCWPGNGSNVTNQERKGSVMKRLSWLVAVLLTGCAAQQKFVFDVGKVAEYVAAHEDRPQAIKTALEAGRPATGMYKQEVELCWGKPNKMLVGEVDQIATETWGYTRAISYGGGRTVWRDVLVKEVAFTNGVVRGWRVITSAP